MQNQIDGPARQAEDAMRSEVRDQLHGAERAFAETRDDLSQKAGGLAGEAKEAFGKQAETVKQGIGGHLDAFGSALNAARDHLESNGQPTASKFVGEASQALGRLASSLHDKPLGELLDDLRDAGRNNAGGVFAGAVLAGLALGRLLRVSGGDSSSSNDARAQANWTGSDGDSQQSATDPAPGPTATAGYAI